MRNGQTNGQMRTVERVCVALDERTPLQRLDASENVKPYTDSIILNNLQM